MKKQIIKLNKAKILVLCTTDNMIWQFLLPHINDLKSYGATIDCVCSKTGFWFDELKEKFGLNMIDVQMQRSPLKLKNLTAYKIIKNLTNENGYNMIYCQQPVGGMIGRLIGKKFKIPVIYTAHGFFFFKGNNIIKNFIFKSAEKHMAKYTDAIITMNNEDYTACQNWKCKNIFKIKISYYALRVFFLLVYRETRMHIQMRLYESFADAVLGKKHIHVIKRDLYFPVTSRCAQAPAGTA